jgi:hypothetical protein
MTGRFGRNRADALSALFVPTRRAKAAFARIDDLLARGWEETFCRGLVMLGHSRVGKTQIVHRYVRERVLEQPDPEKRPNIVTVEVPAGCTLKSFVAELLKALGDADPDYGSQTEKTTRVAEAIERDGVDLIIVDEVQRLIDAETDKIKAEVANWVTGMLNKKLCPFLLVGEKTAERVFVGKTHAKGRMTGGFYIEPYDWADPEDRKEFRAVLHLLDQKLGMPEPAGLGAVDTALRVYAYAEGLLGQAATLIDQARAIARREGRPKLTHDILAEAVDELRISDDRGKANPFRVAAVEDARPAGADAEQDVHVPRRGRGRRDDVAVEQEG